MLWLVDIDSAVADKTLGEDAGAELKRRARQSMINYAVNLALFAGVLMVLGGAAAWLEDRRALAALGFGIAVLGAAALVGGGPQIRLVANAAAIIGVTLALGASAQLLLDAFGRPLVLGMLIGAPCVIVGSALRRAAPDKLLVLGGWIFLLGVAIHIAGILMTPAEPDFGWLVFSYIATLLIGCGFLLDVRFVTALSIVPLATALSSRALYQHATYGVAIYEPTLTILQMTVVAALAFLVSAHYPERVARHARILGHLAIIWINMAFWIGSLWGDDVGSHLWHPHKPFLVIGDGVFSVVWAAVILALGAWGAMTSRRAVLNIAVTFGAIHFYTQYFEHLQATPAAFVFAGVIAILGGWALWTYNRRIAP